MIKEWLFIQIAHADNDLNLPAAPDLSGSNVNQNVALFLNRVAEILLVLAIPLAIMGIIFTASTLIQAAGKPDGYVKAKKMLLYIVTGIFIIVFAAVFIRLSYSLFQRSP
jgi:hypothetical protein